MKTALVILDMVDDFVEGVLANPAAKGTIEPIATLADSAGKEDDWVVLYANDSHRAVWLP